MIYNFLFHRVHPKRDPLWDPMDPVLFEKCIEYISRKFEVVIFEEWAKEEIKKEKAIDKKQDNPQKKLASIMFDDGYKDNFDYALPILEKYNVKASFYIVTDCIDQNIPTWTHIFEHLFQHTQVKEVNIDFDFISKELHIQNLSSKEERLTYASQLKPFLKMLPSKQRNEVLDYVQSIFNDVELPKLMMNWDEIRALKKMGHYIGSHTVSHDMLGTVDDEEKVRFELKESGEKIEEELGYFPTTISYPVGSYDETTIRIAKEEGYLIGLAVKQAIYFPEKSGLFEVERIELYNEPWWKTKMRITNRLEDIKRWIGYGKK